MSRQQVNPQSRYQLALSFLLSISINVWAELPILRVASTGNVFPPIPPYSWYDSCKAHPDGAAVHLLQMMANDLGYELQWVRPQIPDDTEDYQDWPTLIYDYLVAGKADISMASEFDPALFASTDKAIMKLRQSIITRKGKPAPEDLSDLQALQGVMSPFFARRLLEMTPQYQLNIRTSTNTLEALQQVIEGKADYSVLNYYLAKSLTYNLEGKRKHNSSDLHYTHLKSLDQPVFLIMPQSHPNKGLLKQFDRQLNEYTRKSMNLNMEQIFVKRWFRRQHCVIPKASATISS